MVARNINATATAAVANKARHVGCGKSACSWIRWKGFYSRFYQYKYTKKKRCNNIFSLFALRAFAFFTSFFFVFVVSIFIYWIVYVNALQHRRRVALAFVLFACRAHFWLSFVYIMLSVLSAAAVFVAATFCLVWHLCAHLPPIVASIWFHVKPYSFMQLATFYLVYCQHFAELTCWLCW